MSIFDLLDEGAEPASYRFMVLEYGLADPPWRATWWGPDAPSVEAAQSQVRENHPGLAFTDPPEHLLVEGNFGTTAYKNKWDLAAVYRTDTGEVVSVGWLTSPP